MSPKADQAHTTLRVVVLDSCVLYPVTLRDFFVTLATKLLMKFDNS